MTSARTTTSRPRGRARAHRASGRAGVPWRARPQAQAGRGGRRSWRPGREPRSRGQRVRERRAGERRPRDGPRARDERGARERCARCEGRGGGRRREPGRLGVHADERVGRRLTASLDRSAAEICRTVAVTGDRAITTAGIRYTAPGRGRSAPAFPRSEPAMDYAIIKLGEQAAPRPRRRDARRRPGRGRGGKELRSRSCSSARRRSPRPSSRTGAGLKIIVGKYKRRTGYKRHNGFRAATSRVEIALGTGAKKAPGKAEKPERPRRRSARPRGRRGRVGFRRRAWPSRLLECRPATS